MSKLKPNIFDGKENVLVISDTQAPYQHQDTLEFLKSVKKLIKPTKVIHIGDVTDQHALSFHVKNPDLPDAEDEFLAAETFLNQLYNLFPVVELLTSNHDARIARVAEKAGLPSRCIRNVLEVIKAPKGWSIHDHVIYDNVFYQHGDKGRGGENAALVQAKENYMSTVIGHFHSLFNISYFANPTRLTFGMSVGSLINRKALAFNYTNSSKKKPIIGTGAVLKGFPVLIPMPLDDKGRWTGDLVNKLSV